MPLTGLRVLDLTRVISGPFCSMLLGDMGAEVIKIETHDGDTLRTQGEMKDGLSYYYASFNRNKKSITLNLKSPEGRAVLERLVPSADIVVDNFRPGVLDRLGLSRARLRELRPDLICASITGFGESGPYRDRPAFDFIAQAMSGFMSVNGREQDPPLRSGLPVSDLVAGLYCAFGIAAAVVRRLRTGRGDDVSTSLTGGLVSFLAYASANYFAAGTIMPRTGNDHPIAAPYGVFRTRDGVIAIAPNDNQFFARLMRTVGLDELIGRPEYADNRLRVQHRAELAEALEAKLAARDSEDWIARLNEAGVPCSPVYSIDQVFADPQVQEQQMMIDVPHPGRSPVRMLGFPVKFAESPCEARLPAPELGEHTDAVLREAGYDDAEIARLRGLGAI